MAYEENEYKKTNYENDWALDIKDNPIHISNASSGAQGYYCLGCGEEMQAYKSDIRKSFFRHDPRNINKEKVECVVASKVFRERIAESILNRLKFVKVPTLYKYPPKGIEGIPMFLQKSRTITASYTKAQEWFYEDENGYIRNGKNPDIDKRYLLIRPDVTFFNEKKEPILFIEFVITHKLDEEKVAKLSRLGIDTLQIIIPKVPQEEIEKALKSSRKFKWVYNELEANTTYISIPEENSEGLQQIDEEQRKLFEESYSCRAAKINNLVRDINKCIRSESYRRVKRLFESELSRVAQNRERAQQRLGELEERYRAEALGRNRSVEEKLREEEKKLRSNIEAEEQRLGDLEDSNRRDALAHHQAEEDTVEQRYSDLEGRYLDKDRKLEQGMRDYIGAQNIGIPIKRNIEQEKQIVNRYREEKKQIISRIDREKSELDEQITEEFRSKIELEDSEIERLENKQRNLDETVLAEVDTQIDSTERSIGSIGKKQERVENEIWEEFRGEIEFEDSEIERLTNEENECEKTVGDKFHRQFKESTGKLPRGIKAIMDAERLGNDFANAKCEEASYQRAREFFNKGTWQKG